MRAINAPVQTAIAAAHFERAHGIDRLRAISSSHAEATPDLVIAVLDEASRFASGSLAKLNDVADRNGCTIAGGHVITAPGHKDAYRAFAEGGWPTLDQPVDVGGQGLPLSLAFSVQEIFDRACPAFGMLPVPQRSAAKLLAAFASESVRSEWLGPLVSGEWAATICISEADAGSDVMRLRTMAERRSDGTYTINGEKIWISFGDHDLTPRIGHCLLARTTDGEGLSLFLVPDTIDGNPNGVHVRRLEEKMGLHASPTCALGFEGATGYLIGTEGRGLQQMFVMITNMRLATGAQGLGIASSAADIALDYAAQRRQGGGGETPVPINRHVDVQRMLLDQVASVEMFRGLLLTTANLGDLAALEPDEARRLDAAALLQWLLPIVKTTGGEIAFDVSSAAVQILGGAGYTREWPVEQCLRDARVLTIFEGTTGIQALDLLHRRLLKGDRCGLTLFLRHARDVQPTEAFAAAYAETLDLLEASCDGLVAMTERRDAEAGATALLHLAAIAAMGWIAARLFSSTGDTSAERRIHVAASYWLDTMLPKAQYYHRLTLIGSDAMTRFDDIYV